MIQVAAGLNIALGVVGIAWLLLRTTRRRSEYPTEVLLLLYLALALFFGLVSTSVEMWVAGGTPVNVAIISMVKVYALYVLWATRHTKWRTGTRTAEGNPGADQNKDVSGAS